MTKGFSVVKTAGLGILVLLALFLGPEAPSHDVLHSTAQDTEVNAVTKDAQLYLVEWVVDGDTFNVTIDGNKESVRVLGINTPETKYSNRGAECFGAEASVYAKSLLEGTTVKLVPDDTQDTRDKYGRILAYVTLPNGRDFGEVMVADGYAYEYTFKGRAYKNQQLYKAAQTKAQEMKVGLWANRACEG